MLPLLLLFPSLFSGPDLAEVAITTPMFQGLAVPIQVRLKEKPEGPVTLDFLDKEIPCYPAEGGAELDWTCLVGIRVDSEPKEHKLVVRMAGKPAAKLKAPVVEGVFPVETLTLPKDKKDLLTKPGREAELKIIRAALGTETPEKLWQKPFGKPVEGRFESPFGQKRLLDGKIRENYYHRGLDIAADEGTPVVAINAGKVVLAGSFIEEGNMVVVNHGQGLMSAYLHLSKISVKEGDSVSRGTVLGKVGSTGVANNSHLHFGMYIHDVPIDPARWIPSY